MYEVMPIAVAARLSMQAPAKDAVLELVADGRGRQCHIGLVIRT
jgi:hypothetical protein